MARPVAKYTIAAQEKHEKDEKVTQMTKKINEPKNSQSYYV